MTTTQNETSHSYDPALDTPVWGAKAIGEVIGKTERETFWLLQCGHLDASKCGAQWMSTRRRLLFRERA